MPSLLIEFYDRVWHKTPVPIFLEKFILPVFVGAVILLAFSNPMRFDPTQRVTGAGAIIFAAFFVSHSLHKKSDSIKLSDSDRPTTQQQSNPQKPPTSPPVQQHSQGANSPNTNIAGNNNTVTNNTIVNKPAPQTQPPKLVFRDQTDVVSLSLGEGGATFSTSIARLRHGPWQPIYVAGANSPNFSILMSGDTLLVTTSVGGGHFGPVIEVRNNVVAVRDPKFDKNSNEHALEVVNDKGQPVFQLIFKNATHIVINGYFPVPNGRPILAGPDGFKQGVTDEQVASFHLKPIFKYPAWKYPGQYAD
jgi:hypothetical protein